MVKAKIPTCMIAGKRHVLAVFRVETRDEQGRPENCVYIPPDRTVELSSNPDENHFFCAWVASSPFEFKHGDRANG